VPQKRTSSRTPRPPHGAVTVLSSWPTEAEAVREMQRMAAVLRHRKATKRFGIFVERERQFRDPVWWVCLKDRGVKK
jgi:hypothetical protein